MNKSRKLKLVIVLILVCTCSLVSGAEPNETKTNLRFDIKNYSPQTQHLKPIPGTPEMYTHYAVLFVKGDWTFYRNSPIGAILETNFGKSMSEKQRELISNHSVSFRDSGSTISEYTYFQLFGFSEDDVKKMVNAFIEVLANFSNKEMQHFLKRRQEYQELVVETKKRIAEKETEQKDLKNRLEELKNTVHYLSLGETRGAIERLNKTLDELNIELAGMRRKLTAIRQEHEDAKANAQGVGSRKREIYENIIWPKLEQMRIDLIIELTVVEEKHKTARKIRSEAEEFYNLSQQNPDLVATLDHLKRELSNHQGSLDRCEEEIRNPIPQMLPPKVFQNKVTIYRMEK